MCHLLSQVVDWIVGWQRDFALSRVCSHWPIHSPLLLFWFKKPGTWVLHTHIGNQWTPAVYHILFHGTLSQQFHKPNANTNVNTWCWKVLDHWRSLSRTTYLFYIFIDMFQLQYKQVHVHLWVWDTMPLRLGVLQAPSLGWPIKYHWVKHPKSHSLVTKVDAFIPLSYAAVILPKGKAILSF